MALSATAIKRRVRGMIQRTLLSGSRENTTTEALDYVIDNLGGGSGGPETDPTYTAEKNTLATVSQLNTHKNDTTKHVTAAERLDFHKKLTLKAGSIGTLNAATQELDIPSVTEVKDTTPTTGSIKAVESKGLKDSLDLKENKIDSSLFNVPGDENSFGINQSDDTSQKVLKKLNDYTLSINGSLKKSYLVNATNLVAMQVLEPTVAVDDLLFEFTDNNTPEVLTYLVVPLDKFIDLTAIKTIAFKGIVGSPDEHILTLTKIDDSIVDLDLSRFTSTTADDGEIILGTSDVSKTFTPKQIRSEIVNLQIEKTLTFFNSAYLGYGTDVGKTKYVLGSNGSIYEAITTSVPSATNPLTDAINWKTKEVYGTDLKYTDNVLAPVLGFMKTSATGVLIQLTQTQYNNVPEIQVEVEDLDNLVTNNVVIPSGQTFTFSPFYGNDIVIFSNTGVAGGSVALVKRPDNKLQVTYIDQDGVSNGANGRVQNIKVNGFAVSEFTISLDDYVTRNIPESILNKTGLVNGDFVKYDLASKKLVKGGVIPLASVLTIFPTPFTISSGSGFDTGVNFVGIKRLGFIFSTTAVNGDEWDTKIIDLHKYHINNVNYYFNVQLNATKSVRIRMASFQSWRVAGTLGITPAGGNVKLIGLRLFYD